MRLWTYLTEGYRQAMGLEPFPLLVPNRGAIGFIPENESLPAPIPFQYLKRCPRGRVKVDAPVCQAVKLDGHTYARARHGGWERVTPAYLGGGEFG